MAQLTTVSKRTIVDSIEVVADDTSAVLLVSRSDKTTTFRIRKPHEASWDASGPTFTIQSDDAGLLSSVIAGGDVQYRASKLDTIPHDRFTAPNPNPPEDLAEKQRCAELDIERAKAANLAEQKELLRLENLRDHNLDRHITADVEGCPKCDDKTARIEAEQDAWVAEGERAASEIADADDDSLPF